MLKPALLATLVALPFQAHAQDGGQLFTTYCSACHGPDGKGATGGVFPPLAGSDWVVGDPARAVKIVLHGLHGEVEVDGRKFNLEMPPQGGVLPDDQIAAILSYVRSSWGNKAEAVTLDFVKATRAATTDRKAQWTQAEILKLHPLPPAKPPIDNLISQVFTGDWQKLPDFSKLQGRNIEEEHDGKISLKKAGLQDLFGMVWQGDLTAPETGDYFFRLGADDGARVILDGKTVAEVNGIGPMDGRAKEGSINLTAGVHKIRVEYFEYKGQEEIALAWRGPGIPRWKSLSDAAIQGGRESIPLIPLNGRAVVYRNFIEGTTPRGIGIGFPGGVNLAYSADDLAPELIWTGEFMDASKHWTDRGQGNQAPAGDHVVKLSGTRAFPEAARFKGYKLDPTGNPTFSVQLGNQFVLDSWKPGTAANGAPALVRTLTANGQGDAINMLVSDKLPLKKDGTTFALGDSLLLQANQADIESRDGKAYLKLAPGQSATLTYSWK